MVGIYTKNGINSYISTSGRRQQQEAVSDCQVPTATAYFAMYKFTPCIV